MAINQNDFNFLDGGSSFGDYSSEAYQQPAPSAPTPAGPAPAPVAPGPATDPATDQVGPAEGPTQDERNERRLASRPAPAPAPAPPPAPPGPPVGITGATGPSAETGGVQGSFRQAGSSDFGQRFGSASPANWYRQSVAGLNGGNAQATQQIASRSGGAGGGGGDLGNERDQEQFLRQVQQNMFRPGG